MERYCIIIKDVLSGKETIYPYIYYSLLDAKISRDDSSFPYSHVYNDIFIKLII